MFESFPRVTPVTHNGEPNIFTIFSVIKAAAPSNLEKQITVLKTLRLQNL